MSTAKDEGSSSEVGTFEVTEGRCEIPARIKTLKYGPVKADVYSEAKMSL